MMLKKTVLTNFSRVLRGAVILICFFTAIFALSSLIYLLLVGKINILSAVFSATLVFFIIILPMILSFRMPGSIGIFFLIIGSGVFLASLEIVTHAKGKCFFVGSAGALILSGAFLILSFFAEKIYRKSKE